MRLTFGNTAYVDSCTASKIDAIERSGLSITMTGEGLVATTYEALTEYVMDTPQDQQDETYSFLKTTRNNINTYKRRRSICEIIFSA